MLGVAHELADEEAVVEDVVVAQRGTLGESCCAGGVLDVDGVVGAERGHPRGQLVHGGAGTRGHQLVPAALADVDDLAQVRALRPHLFDHGPVVGRLVHHCADEHAQAGLLEDIGKLVTAIGRVDVDQHRADLGRGVLQQGPLRAVQRPDADPVAGVDAFGQQAKRQRRDVSIELGVRPAATAGNVDQRFGLGETQGSADEVVTDRVAQQRRVGGS